jgi:protein-S-isoprenylcysteine O-methyltransferase Ste14
LYFGANFADAKFACGVCLKKSLPATGKRTSSINELTRGESRDDFGFYSTANSFNYFILLCWYIIYISSTLFLIALPFFTIGFFTKIKYLNPSKKKLNFCAR